MEEPDLKSVTLGALNGLLESIDPFASYLNADQYKEYLKHNDAKGDVGLILSKRFGYIGVVSAVPGSPAAKAGLSTGDIVETIKGVALAICRWRMRRCCCGARRVPRSTLRCCAIVRSRKR